MQNGVIVPQEEIVRKSSLILDELFKAFRLSPDGAVRRLLEPLVKKPAMRFTSLFGEIELTKLRYGLAAAVRRGLREFTKLVKVSGNENIPAKGPLLIVSNHVGAFDVLVILSQILRNDIKAIASDIPFLHAFPVLYQHLIFTNFQANSGMQAARHALRQLKDGGALLLFASAGIDPDPALYPQAARQELSNWKPSLDIFLRQVPETQVVVSIVRGIVSQRWAEHPLRRIGRRPIDQRRIVEMLQIIDQLLFPGRLLMESQVQFSRPMTAAEMSEEPRLALIRMGEEMLQA
jgi:hypothetical protein